ncbi:MAG: hypothetical protein Kow0076_6780 [Francisella sp.]
MKKSFILLDYFLKNLFMMIFWFAAGLFVGYLIVKLAVSESVYSILKPYGFIWMSIYGAIKVSAVFSIIFAVIFAVFDENKKILILPMIIAVVVLYFIQYSISSGILLYLSY